ncbi:MAG: helix-turn-helix domain-containing protein [Butyrivibrio sp.]|nr:helix-turn-helix domain-containing protein [Butyrivibrio sp.]
MELKNRPKRQIERNKEIVAYRKVGITYRQIARHFGISICRVRQIIEVWEGRDE